MSNPIANYTCRNGHTGRTYLDKVGKKVCRQCRRERVQFFERQRQERYDKLVEFVVDVAKYGNAHYRSSGIEEALELLEEIGYGPQES